MAGMPRLLLLQLIVGVHALAKCGGLSRVLQHRLHLQRELPGDPLVRICRNCSRPTTHPLPNIFRTGRHLELAALWRNNAHVRVPVVALREQLLSEGGDVAAL